MTTLERQELKEAALNGDVEFLKKCIASHKPLQFYSTFFPIEEDRYGKYHHGNIFHIATIENREEFIGEIIQILPVEETQRLLIQPNNEELKWNPLHIAAMIGNVEIVKMFLDVYTSSIPSLHSQRPWLLRNFEGNNPLQVAHMRCHEECALQLLKMDQEMFCNMIHEACGASIIYEAIYNRMSKLALEILRSPHSIGYAGREGKTPLHVICHLECSDETKEIFRRLLQREPGLIKQKSGEEGLTIFHCWAKEGKMCLFKYLLENDDILPDVKRVFVDLIDQTSCDGENPLHCLARNSSSQKDAIEISELLIDIYKKEASTRSSEHQLPWLVHSKDIETPLWLAIGCGHEMFAMHILSVDENAVITCQKNVLFLAIKKRCHQVAKKILEIVHKNGWTQLLTDDNHINVLHFAPLCTKDLCTQLIENHPEFLEGVGKGGITVLHSWIMIGVKVWLIELICKSKCRHTFAKLIEARDYIVQNNPFHYAAITTNHEETSQVVELLVTLYKEENTNRCNHINLLPWFLKNKEGDGPLHLAIRNQRQELALYILSLHRENHLNKLLDYYTPEHVILFLAIRKNCHRVAQYILKRLDKGSCTKYLRCPTHGDNILHLATNLTDEEFGTWLVSAAPEFITEQDYNEQSPWDKAYEVESVWFIKAALKTDPSVFNSAPLSWIIKACENGHVSALRAFIDHNPGAVRDLCIEHKDSPLHHIKLQSLTDYELFLEIPRMKDLINLQDSKGATPLHKAIRNEDLFLTETLLNMDKVIYDINDDENVSAIDLLAQQCNEYDAWDRMCKRTDLSVFNRAPLSWFKACENGHVSALRAFIDRNPGAFRDLCIEHKDSPLHHIKLQSLTDYELFLEIPRMKDLINLQDSKGATPLHKAIRNEDLFLTETLLNMDKVIYDINDDENVSAIDLLAQQCNEYDAWDRMCKRTDLSVFNRAPLSWFKACENGHVSALRAFIDRNPGAFRDLCIGHKDSPLHHIKLQSLTDYELFLEIPRMKDLINLQDSKGATPLHKAIRNEDLFLTETLLNMDKVKYNIIDDEDVSAVDLLDQKCNESDDKQTWERMCTRIGVDPSTNTTYFKSKTNLLDVRNSLFLVAALLATITFTAGFTLPGGFNQVTGEALLSKNASFLVFMIFDTSAFFFSMLVLICLIWSMVYEKRRSLVLIDRSMVLLRVALNCTILTFMTGIYTVVAQKSMWAAILIIVIMCTLIGISVNKDLLYKVIDNSILAPKKKRVKKIVNHDVEMARQL